MQHLIQTPQCPHRRGLLFLVYTLDMARIRWVVGVDEAGRGPLAGPVSVAALAFPEPLYAKRAGILHGIRDSKKLTELGRERWYTKLSAQAKAGNIKFASSMVSHSVIDRRGISKATALGVARTLIKLDLHPATTRVLLDGSLAAPALWRNQKTIVRGDDRVAIIAAASVIAKVRRDRRMERFSLRYPDYGFAVHKGYGTASHYRMLKKRGLSLIHRRSFCKKLFPMV